MIPYPALRKRWFYACRGSRNATKFKNYMTAGATVSHFFTEQVYDGLQARGVVIADQKHTFVER